jgi:hypothetical protein
MKKKLAVCSVVAVLVAICVSMSVYAQDDMMTLEPDIFVDRQRPAVLFPHSLHADELGIDCLECHHVYDAKGENVWDDSEESNCTACHKLEADGKKMPAMKAFHTNCQGCHEEEGRGPVTCGECHLRTKQAPKETH